MKNTKSLMDLALELEEALRGFQAQKAALITLSVKYQAGRKADEEPRLVEMTRTIHLS